MKHGKIPLMINKLDFCLKVKEIRPIIEDVIISQENMKGLNLGRSKSNTFKTLIIRKYCGGSCTYCGIMKKCCYIGFDVYNSKYFT